MADKTITVSQDGLEMLMMGRNELVRRRDQVRQQLQELDALILRQEGGIELMQELLQAQPSAPVSNGDGGES